LNENITSAIKIKTLKRVMKEPNDEYQFQAANISGNSAIRRGNPKRPKKCIGKKTKFTPIKKNQKCNFAKPTL